MQALAGSDPASSAPTDQASRYLYYIPKPGQDIKTADVELPVDQSLLTLQGTPGRLAPADQNDPNASYTGTGWQTYTDRNLGDLGNDIAAPRTTATR